MIKKKWKSGCFTFYVSNCSLALIAFKFSVLVSKALQGGACLALWVLSCFFHWMHTFGDYSLPTCQAYLFSRNSWSLDGQAFVLGWRNGFLCGIFIRVNHHILFSLIIPPPPWQLHKLLLAIWHLFLPPGHFPKLVSVCHVNISLAESRSICYWLVCPSLPPDFA